MSRKKFRLISLGVAWLGILLVLAALIAYGVTFHRLVESMQTNGGGIIGGADVPTMFFILRSNGAISTLFLCEALTFIGGMVSLIFAKKNN